MTAVVQANRVRDVFLNAIRALTEALEAKDPYTAEHSRRVTALAVEIAVAMDLPKTDVAQVRLAAMLHDVGKIGIRGEILQKPYKLTSEEYDHVMQHVEIGCKILEPLFRGNAILAIVSAHHEQYDGTGRPGALRGSRIPLGARIIAVADAVDAMASVRLYREALPGPRIVEEVRTNAGTQFDPRVVEGFLETAFAAGLSAEKNDSVDDLAGDACLDEPPPPPGEAPEVMPEAAAEPDAPVELPARPLLEKSFVVKAISEARDIKALPFVTAEILNLTSRPDTEMDSLIETILRDPALTAKILKLANTSFYASKGRVQSIDRAVVNIGYSGIRELALGVAVVDLFEGKDVKAIDRMSLWRHQIACAAVARALAQEGGAVAPEDAFVAGLLHDLGIDVLDDLFPEAYVATTKYARANPCGLAAAERAFLGLDHASVADELSQAWNIERRYRLAMAHHHDDWSRIGRLEKGDATLVSIVKAADNICAALGRVYECGAIVEDLPRAALRNLGLDSGKIERALRTLPEVIMELQAIFMLQNIPPEELNYAPAPIRALEGKSVFFVDPTDKPFDIVKCWLESRGVSTRAAATVKASAGADMPDVVFLRAGNDEAFLRAQLKELSRLSTAGVACDVKVVVLGGASAAGKLASLYPANLTATVEEPYSLAGLEKRLEILLGA